MSPLDPNRIGPGVATARRAGMPMRWVLPGALFWTAIGVVFALPQLALAGHRPGLWSPAWSGPLAASLATWWAWGLLTPAIIGLDHLLPFGSRDVARRVLAHAVIAPLVTVAYVYLSTILMAGFGVARWSRLADPRLVGDALRGGFVWGLLVYGLIVGVLQAVLAHRRYVSAELRMERLERSFSEARLNTLRMQLDPHFLFNALNTISSQVVRDATLARDMIEHLGELLRLSLDPRSRHEVRLEQEMALLDHYLAIQAIRFGDRLTITLDIPSGVRQALVPSLVMQPLVENAIRHGLAPRATGGTITVTARRVGDRLDLRVCDDGIGLPPGWALDPGQGLGLPVTRERVAGFHPAGTGSLRVAPRTGGGTEVALSLPFRLRADERDHAA